MTVYDFAQLACAPYRLILAACESGLQARPGPMSLLGLFSSLVPLERLGSPPPQRR
jgi:hypothetical protein